MTDLSATADEIRARLDVLAASDDPQAFQSCSNSAVTSENASGCQHGTWLRPNHGRAWWRGRHDQASRLVALASVGPRLSASVFDLTEIGSRSPTQSSDQNGSQ